MDAMGNIEHIVVLMFENRSLDNVLGWLYADTGNRPPVNLPDNGRAPTYDGLVEGTYWNPSNPLYLQDPSVDPRKAFVTRGTRGPSPLTVPNPGPEELFEHMTFQLFGTSRPARNQPANMLGFLVDHQRQVGPERASEILQTYTPDQLPVLSALARSYAVSDRWFASVPAQTWPNRSFLHAGTSEGHVNNWPLTPYDVKTIYEALEERRVSWGIYFSRFIPPFGTMAQITMKRLRALPLRRRVQPLSKFKEQARDGTLPTYSLIEPPFTSAQAASMHPPEDVRLAERFLFDVYQAVSTGRHWESTLLIVTFDEHGACYDHVPPPWGATPPDRRSSPGDEGFGFDRFGGRVPTLLISPWVEAGTVFRSPGPVPYDHTSILRTLRDWAGLPDDMLPSERIRQAPGFAKVLTRSTARRDRPDLRPLPVTPQRALHVPDLRARPIPPLPDPGQQLLNDLERDLVMAVEQTLRGDAPDPSAAEVLTTVRTRADLLDYMRSASARAADLEAHSPAPQ